MFENFSFSPAAKPSALVPDSSNFSPLTPPVSPRDSPAPDSAPSSPVCYTFRNFSHHEALTSTLFALSISPAAAPPPSSRPRQYASPDTSDSESEPEFALEEVRRKRQSMARMQTSEDLLRQLGELVKRVSSDGPRKTNTRSLVETNGITKRGSKGGRSRSGKASSKPRDTNGSGRRLAA